MKRSTAIAAMVFWLAAGAAQAQVRLNFKLTGGFAYLGGGDLNKGLQGWSDLWDYAYDVPWIGAMGGYEPVHLGPDYGAEILIGIGSHFRIGLGAGRLSASKSSSLDLVQETGTDHETWNPKITAVPLSLNAYYVLPAGRINLMFHLGAAYYKARYTDTQHVFFAANYDDTYDLTGNGIGFQGGLGFDIPLTRWLGLLVEVDARYAPIGGFKGDYVRRTTSSTTAVNGKLWLCETADFPHFPFLLVAETQPSASSIGSVTEAKADFSGVSLRAGFLIRL
jgi:hypothetical protein